MGRTLEFKKWYHAQALISGIQAESPQVALFVNPAVVCHYCLPIGYLPSVIVSPPLVKGK